VRDAVVAALVAAPGPRLAVDRSFSVRGRGTVVTGSLGGGAIDLETRLRLVPGANVVRVRGIEAASIARGMVLTGDRAVVASDRILVALRPATSLATPAPRRPETLPRDG